MISGCSQPTNAPQKGRPVMIMGCTSDAGKSLLTAALCRHLSNAGLRVAPFKAQNMSNNAAVTSEGLEMGRAQYLQALACRATPEVRMNPVLLKPTSDTSSQVVVMGVPNVEVAKLPWNGRRDTLFPVVTAALDGLIADYDRVVIEGAGSPAEVNLRAGDIVNMAVALHCQADVFIVADIDRGGAFAHLLGTFLCLSPAEQALVKGFVLNKFRGDPTLLDSAKMWLQERTGVPTVAVVPMVRHQLPEEDAFRGRGAFVEGAVNVALLIYPYAANMDEFDPIMAPQSGVNVVVIHRYRSLLTFDAVILPGSKNTCASLAWLREQGLDRAITAFAATGKTIIGVCGGLQMLGRTIEDPCGVDSGGTTARGTVTTAGLDLIPLATVMAPQKTTRQRTIQWVPPPLSGPHTVDPIPTKALTGYEIHHGQTQIITDHAVESSASSSKPNDLNPSANTMAYLPQVLPFIETGLGFQLNNIFGLYLHGAFENSSFVRWFLLQIGAATVLDEHPPVNWYEHVDDELQKLGNLFAQDGWKV